MKEQFNEKKLSDTFSAKNAGLGFTLASIAPTIISSCLLFIVFIIALSMNGMENLTEFLTKITDSNTYAYIALLFSQLSFLLVAILISRLCHVRIAKAIPIKKLKVKDYIFIPILAFGIIFGLSIFQNLFIMLLELIGYTDPMVAIPSPTNIGELFISLIIVCVFPAFCEEIIFRGIVLEGLKKTGEVSAIILSGICFSIFHQNPSQTLYQFLAGMLFALITIRTGSILPSMIIHFINNAVIILFTYFGIAEMPLTLSAILTVLGLIALVVSIFVYLRKNKDVKPILKTERKIEFFKYACYGLAFCFVVWLTTFLA